MSGSTQAKKAQRSSIVISPYIERMYGKYLDGIQTERSKGHEANAVTVQQYAYYLTELKAGNLANTEEQYINQKKNPNRYIVNMSRKISPTQIRYITSVEKEIRQYSEITQSRLREAYASDDMLAKHFEKYGNNPAKLRKRLASDEAFKNAYIKALASVKKPGTTTRKIIKKNGTEELYEGEESGLNAWVSLDSP